MRDVLSEFGNYLDAKGLSFEVTIIGGAALLVMGIIDRATQDVDCLDPDIPEAVRVASGNFAAEYEGTGAPLREDWLNSEPKALREELSAGWRERIVSLYRSAGIHVQTLGRLDLLKTKLFAYCDRQQDEQDCIDLAPTVDELSESLEWVR